MKLIDVFQSEFASQAGNVRTWLFFGVLFAVAFLLMRTATGGAVLANSPYCIAQETVLTGLLWILMAPVVAGSAAASAPIDTRGGLFGRFLAAFAVNAAILLAVPLGMLAAVVVPGMAPTAIGPLRQEAYLSSYGVLALPTAFAFTAVQFSAAALHRRAIVSYLGTGVFLFAGSVATGLVTNVLQMPVLGQLLDPTVRMTVLNRMESTLTPLEMNTVLVGLEQTIVANRLIWIVAACAVLAFTHVRFRPGLRTA